MRNRLPAVLGFVVLVGCGRSPTPAQAPAPEPTARVVYVVVTATPAPQKEDPVLANALRQEAMTTYAAGLTRTALSASSAWAVPSGGAVPTVPPKPKPETPYCVVEDFLIRPPNSIGAIWFDGEVRNLGSQPAKVKVLVKAYSINEVLLDSKSFWPDRHPIPPGERAHFNNYVESKTGDEIRKVIPELIPE